MKVTFEENKDNFWLELQPETIAEASTLARLGLNNTKRGVQLYVHAGTETITGSLMIKKPVNEKCYITAP